MDSQCNKKVYINPNYKPNSKGNIYINQNFVEPKVQPNNSHKIFVNPNFIRTNNATNQRTLSDHSQIQHPINLSSLNPNIHYNAQFLQDCNDSFLNQQPLTKPYSYINNHSINWPYPQLCNQPLDQLQPDLINKPPENQYTNKYKDIQNETTYTETEPKENILCKSRYTLVRSHISQNIESNKLNIPFKSQSLSHNQTLSNLLPISKSRYQLIRHQENQLPCPSPLVKKRTLKINKYKSINLDTAKKLENKYSDIANSKIMNCSGFKTKEQLSYSLISNGTLRTHRQTKNISKAEIDRIKGKLKINNVPCRLFCKYGKCLRNINSKCPYVHNRKHVSLCKKFLKGVCHDENCLLSHELSKKKMPTCYFYLKGMCVKDGCPYLHVKLSDHVKICKDFLKGYCEKGETCLFRHVKQKKSKITKKSSNNSRIMVKKVPSEGNMKLTVDKPSSNKEENTVLEDRYFKDSNQPDFTNSDTIKPTRCKLGNLPSFIKL